MPHTSQRRSLKVCLLPAIAPLLLTLLTAGCSRDPEVLKARYVASGDRYATDGKLAEAVLEYRNAVQAVGSDGDARLKLADAYAKTGNIRGAVEQHIRAADLLPERIDVQVRAGNLLLVSRRFDDAKVRAEKALAIDSTHVEAQILLANALAGLKDLNGAVAELEEAIKLAPDRSATYSNLGVIEITRGRRDAAERAFEKAIELDPRSAKPLLAAANFYWAIGRAGEAESALARALALEPDNVLALKAITSFSIAQNRLDEAEKHLKRLVEITKSRDAIIALADFHIARNNATAARNLLQPLSTGAEASAAANIRLAAMDHGTGHKEQAYRALDAVIAANKTNLQALLVRTSMLLSDGRRDEALAAAELAVKSHPESAAAHFAVGRVQAARNHADAASAAFRETLRLNPRATGAQIALSRLQLAAGKASESVGLAQEAVRIDPASADARLVLVRGLLAKGDLARAESELKQLLADYPDLPAVRVQKGLLLARQRNLVGARVEFEAALKSDPASVEALGGLVAVELATNQRASALARLAERAGHSDATAPLLMLAARTYAGTGDVQTAEQYLRRVLQKDPTYLQAYGALGQLYLKQRRLDAALTEFDALAERDPKPVAALTLAGIILDAQGKTSEARARFERVLQIDSNAPVAANNLAWLMAEAGDNLDVALQLAQTAQRGLPESPEVTDTLGVIYYKKGLFALAIPPLKASVAKNPANPFYQFHLGLAYAKSGDTTNARQALERALALKSDFKGADEARSVLESLKQSE
jgi:tetratricopeptide (TPR) repeat protein